LLDGGTLTSSGALELEPRLQHARLRWPLPHRGAIKKSSAAQKVRETTPKFTKHHNTAKMPKSKRAKVVHLTKTDKKGKELSQKLFANVQEAAENFEHIFVFSVENMRNSYLKEVRAEFSDSR
jgi:5S rRNA maturation endonuclease (ribonuclease M5)